MSAHDEPRPGQPEADGRRDDAGEQRRKDTNHALEAERAQSERHLARGQTEREATEQKLCDEIAQSLPCDAVTAERLRQAEALRLRREGYAAEQDSQEEARRKTGEALHRERAAADVQGDEAEAAREETGREKTLRTQAEEAVRSRDRLVAIVSHDLRNPLNVVTMNLGQLLRTLPSSEVESRQRRWIESAIRATHRMNAMIGDLLDLASIEAGRFSVSSRGEAVGALVQEAAEMMAPLAAEKNIVIRTAVAERPGEVECDKERILQVFSNLIGNAIRYSHEGSEITITAEAGDREAKLGVSDRGRGVSKEDQPHVFDRYWQAERSTRKGLGLGLGLSIVKGIVEAHRGRVWVESEPGTGARFFFTLPRPPETERRAA